MLKPIIFHSGKKRYYIFRYVYVRRPIGRHVIASNATLNIEDHLPLMTAWWKRLLRQIVLINNYTPVDEVTVRSTQISQ